MLSFEGRVSPQIPCILNQTKSEINSSREHRYCDGRILKLIHCYCRLDISLDYLMGSVWPLLSFCFNESTHSHSLSHRSSFIARSPASCPSASLSPVPLSLILCIIADSFVRILVGLLIFDSSTDITITFLDVTVNCLAMETGTHFQDNDGGIQTTGSKFVFSFKYRRVLFIVSYLLFIVLT